MVRENDDTDDHDDYDVYTSTAGVRESVKCIMIREGQLNTMKQHCVYAQTYNFKLDSKKPNLLTVILSQNNGSSSVIVGNVQLQECTQITKILGGGGYPYLFGPVRLLEEQTAGWIASLYLETQ